MKRFSLAILILIVSCSGSESEEGIPTLETGEKADNFYSDTASEYEVTGEIALILSPEEYNDVEYRENYISRRLTAVGLYLTTYMTDKFRGIDINNDGEISDDEVFFHNEDYGGFHAMVRNHTVEPVEAREGDGGNYFATFTIDLAGPKELLDVLSNLPDATTTTSTVQFDLQMPLGEAVDPEDVPRRVIRRFDPADHTGDLETIRCTIRKLIEPADAYPHFAEFIEDGVYDITLFFGHDYNDPRSDLREAEESFDRLESLGFEAPASTFDELDENSGPFVRDIRANEQDVRVEVRIFHSDMFTDDRPGQHDLAIDEMVARDVFFYNGHAGPYYGFYLDAAHAATVYYSEFADAPFDENRQQIFIAQGCQTYSQYADMIYENPAKNEDNLDVIVTVNYSYGSGTLGLLENLISIDWDGNHVPQRFYEIIGDLNRDWINNWYNVFYGVTGIDGNPQVHPYANLDVLGETCTSHEQCGDPTGNICAHYEGQNLCSVYALTADSCPATTVFGVVEIGYQTRGVCFGLPPEPEPDPTPEAPGEGDVVVTEIMANPDVRSDYTGEWFEVYNRSESAVDLNGCVIGDDDGLTHAIDGEVIIESGAYAVFSRTDDPGFVPDFVYGRGYYIANRGDEIIIDCGGTTIDRVAYSGRVRAGKSFSLPPSAIDATVNDDMGNWCYGVDIYAESGSKTDRGTPGEANPECE